MEVWCSPVHDNKKKLWGKTEHGVNFILMNFEKDGVGQGDRLVIDQLGF